MSQHQGDQCSTAGDMLVWESHHLGFGLVTATNSVGDNELGPLLSGVSAYLYAE